MAERAEDETVALSGKRRGDRKYRARALGDRPGKSAIGICTAKHQRGHATMLWRS